MVAPPLWSPTIILNRELTSAYEPQALGLCIVYLSGLRALAWKLGLPWRDEATCNHQQKAWQCCPSVLKPTVSPVLLVSHWEASPPSSKAAFLWLVFLPVLSQLMALTVRRRGELWGESLHRDSGQDGV